MAQPDGARGARRPQRADDRRPAGAAPATDAGARPRRTRTEPAADEPPAEEEQPAMEHEIVADVPERHRSRGADEARLPNSRPRCLTSRRSRPRARARRPSTEERGHRRTADRASPGPDERRGVEVDDPAPRPQRRRGVRGRGRRLLERAAPLRRTRPGPGGPRRLRPGRGRGPRLERRAAAGPRGPRAGGASRGARRAEPTTTTSPSPPPQAATTTCSRRRPTSSRRLPRTTSSGSSRSRPRTSTSTTEGARRRSAGSRRAYTSPDGAIAQLAERRLCKAEVAGSIPAGSTIAPDAFLPAAVWRRLGAPGERRLRCLPT